MKYRIEIKARGANSFDIHPIEEGSIGGWDEANDVVETVNTESPDGSGTVHFPWMLPEGFEDDFLMEVYDEGNNLVYKSDVFLDFFGPHIEEEQSLMETHPEYDNFEEGLYLVRNSITGWVGATFHIEDETFREDEFRLLPLKGFDGFGGEDYWVDMTCAAYNGKYTAPEDGWYEIPDCRGSEPFGDRPEIYIYEKYDNGVWSFRGEFS